MSALDLTVGARYKVVLSDGATFESDVFAVEDGIVAFRSEAAHTYAKADYHVVPVAHIKSAEHLGAGRPELPWRMPGAEELASREEQSLVAPRRRDRARTAGVTPEALPVFEKLSKAYNDVTWDDGSKAIVILERAVLVAPYDVTGLKKISGVPEDEGLMTRLREKQLPRIWADIRGGGAVVSPVSGAPSGAPSLTSSSSVPGFGAGAGAGAAASASGSTRGGGSGGGGGGGGWTKVTGSNKR